MSTPYPRGAKQSGRCDFSTKFREGTEISARLTNLYSSTPSMRNAGGNEKMIISQVCAQQPVREPWSRERLLRERAIALGQAIDVSTWKNYGSALNSYLSFVHMHNMPVEPTPDSLSLFTVYMCHHIKPDSMDTYLSGICQQLEPYFPHVREIRRSRLVHPTLQGCKHLRGTPTIRK
ncbi:hypothetical protein L208DRAFT_1406309 [Tricholoma matsutake]|nr:hypothetical protein L208DRAFT_1406309 [Tricholoma matsutake 945]